MNKNWDFNGGYVAINSFGFGGANAHVLLKSNSKTKTNKIVNHVPRLIAVSGRTEEAVNNMLKNVHFFLEFIIYYYFNYQLNISFLLVDRRNSVRR